MIDAQVKGPLYLRAGSAMCGADSKLALAVGIAGCVQDGVQHQDCRCPGISPPFLPASSPRLFAPPLLPSYPPPPLSSSSHPPHPLPPILSSSPSPA
eukprot:3932326-Rhodomonas_salina.1